MIERFLTESDPSRALQCWLDGRAFDSLEHLLLSLEDDVAVIDRLLNEQLNAILHHEKFQRLEASWRGLQYLADAVADEQELRPAAAVQLKLLSITWNEMRRDFDRNPGFDQSAIFHKVYEQGIGMPGENPFGVMIGDYEFSAPRDDHVGVLRSMMSVAAAAFCPFVTNAGPKLFDLDDFAVMQYRLDHERTFDQLAYLKWRALRDEEDARFLALTLPRILMRTPYEDDGTRIDGFAFRERVAGRQDYLWGGAAYALGRTIIRAYASTGWLADIRGVRRGEDGGGIVSDLPVHSFRTDANGVSVKSSTEVVITDECERQLSNLGFMPLCDCADTDWSAFYSVPTLQKPKPFQKQIAAINARISSLLHCVLCASRFAHYVKVIGRETVGSFQEEDDLEAFLHDWIFDYVTSQDDASPEMKARCPLRDASIRVTPVRGTAGSFNCVMHLVPHHELDELSGKIRLRTELAPARAR